MLGSSEQGSNEGKCQAGPGEASIDRFRGDRQAAGQIADTHSLEVGAGLQDLRPLRIAATDTVPVDQTSYLPRHESAALQHDGHGGGLRGLSSYSSSSRVFRIDKAMVSSKKMTAAGADWGNRGDLYRRGRRQARCAPEDPERSGFRRTEVEESARSSSALHHIPDMSRSFRKRSTHGPVGKHTV